MEKGSWCCCQVTSAVSNSVRPHRLQPTRLPHPWDSPGKNTGVGCHFLLQCMKVKSESVVTQSWPALCDPMDCSLPGSSSLHGIFQARVLQWVATAFSNGIILINNYLKCKWVEGPNQRAKTGWMDTKTRPLYMLSTRDPPWNKGHLQTENEGLEKDIPCK